MNRLVRHKSVYFIIAYFILMGAVIFLLYSRYTTLTESYTQGHVREFDQRMQSYQLMQEQMMDSYYELFFNSSQVTNIMQEAAHSDPARQAIFRHELMGRLQEAFGSLQRLNVRLLFFHLPEQIAFLRMHEPEKFGDSLSVSRPSIVEVQTQQKKLIVFETGKLFSGFRSIYPLFYHDSFVGSVEIAYPFLALKKQAIRESSGAYTFLVKRSIQEKKSTSSDILKHYQNSMFTEEYFEDKESALDKDITGFTQDELKNLLTQNEAHIKNALKQERLQGVKLRYDGKDALMVLRPVKQFNGEHAAYMVEITPDHTFFAQQFNQLVELIIIIGLLLALLMWYAYRYYSSIVQLNQSLLKAQEAEQIKSTFIANMSHEIRTPLNGIVGFVQLLSSSSIDSKQRRYLSIIENSIDTLMHIVNDVLDFSKIQESKIEIEFIESNPKIQFDAVFSLFISQADTKKIAYQLNLDTRLHECLKLDIYKLKQVVSNLISNALKFTPEGGEVHVKIEVVDETAAYQEIRFCVSDTGIGIPLDKQDKIFEKFTQADSSTTRQFGGTGLGLSISYAMVGLMGGVLEVKSTEGEGSTFSFTLKVEKCTTLENPLKTADEHKDNSIQPVSLNVLVAEDHDVNQILIDELLIHNYGINADFANNGEIAVEMVAAKNYDLILMDVNMPVMDGIEATRIIRDSHPKLPIVALTANAFEGDRERFIAAGMNDYLTKPLDAGALRDMLIRYKITEILK